MPRPPTTTSHPCRPERYPVGMLEPTKTEQRLFRMPFASVYPLYVEKAERKGRSKEEVDEVIRWLTGYEQAGVQAAIDAGTDVEGFFTAAPRMNPNTALITGVVCGVRVEQIENPLMQRIRWLDKLVDELARGKKLESILRGSVPAA